LPVCDDLAASGRAIFEQRFGVPGEVLDGMAFAARRDELWATTAPSTPLLAAVRPAGVRALRRTPMGLKPTSTFLRVLGDNVRRHRVDLSRDELERLLLGRPLPTDADEGFVALAHRGVVLGCGRAARGTLRPLLPLARRKALLESLPS